jgi:hypothetical protein
MTPTGPESVRVSFADGYQHEWTIQHHVTVEDTFEQIRETIETGRWFEIPGTGRSYSPYAIVSVELVEAAAESEPSAAHRLGQEVREHVIDPIAKET